MGEISHESIRRPLTAGRTIFDYADELALRVPTSCGRTGDCHECIVEIKRGAEALCPPTSAERFLRGRYRLACQAVVEDATHDLEFSLPLSHPRILTAAPDKRLEIDPLVTRRGDKVCYDGRVIGDFQGHLFGIALDLGTTTVVAEFVNLATGESVYLASFENPQSFGGSDVMHRISYDGGAFRGELQRAVTNALNCEIREMCRRVGVSRQEIYEIVVAGNSTMRDLFFGLDVQSIGQRPYQSQIEKEYRAGKRPATSLLENASQLGVLVHPEAKVFGAPLVGGHVGGDISAGLTAIDMASQDDVVMLVDIGTNTEVVVGHAGRMMAASCPAGPAFEGGGTAYGMPAADGAIESLHLSAAGAEYEVIGGGEPRGFCGSGLIDLLAELRREEHMSPLGVFADGSHELTIVPEQGITFSREDASNLAQAKAANYCGQLIVMRAFGLRPADISKLYLAGGFANYVNVRHAMEIGFLAPVPADRVVKIGNAAVQGAKELLLSRRKRESIESLVQRVEHVELETSPDFFDLFVEGCQFKPMPQDLAVAGE